MQHKVQENLEGKSETKRRSKMKKEKNGNNKNNTK